MDWVLVHFARKNWLFPEQTGFGQFWPKKWFWLILTGKTGFDQKKKPVVVDIGWKKVVLVDFDPQKGLWSTLTGKTGPS